MKKRSAPERSRDSARPCMACGVSPRLRSYRCDPCARQFDRERYHRYKSPKVSGPRTNAERAEAAEVALVEFVRTHRPLTWAYLTRPIGDDS